MGKLGWSVSKKPFQSDQAVEGGGKRLEVVPDFPVTGDDELCEKVWTVQAHADSLSARNKTRPEGIELGLVEGVLHDVARRNRSRSR